MGSIANGLMFISTCMCAGTGCGGHLMAVTPGGYQSAVQHTYTRACDGFHPAGPCPEPRVTHSVLALPAVT
jgi:hypothetical protein